MAPFLPHDAATLIATLGVFAGMVTAGSTMLRKLPGLPAKEQRAWRTLAYGLLLIAVGMVVFVVAYLGSYDATFGLPDLGFLTGYVTGMAGIALLPHTKGNALQRIRLLLDGIIGAVALSALAWVFFYTEVAAALADSPTWERIVGSAYPILDVLMLVVVMIVFVRRSSYRFDPRLILLAIGSVVLAISDMAFLLTGAGRSFSEAEPLFAPLLVAVACFVALGAGVDHPIEAREYAERPATPLWALVIPYGTAAIMVGVLVTRVRWPGITMSDTILVIATAIVGGLVFTRQALAIRENRRYLEAQRAALVTSISHELRTPLTAMVGFLELLDSGGFPDGKERREVVTIVTEQATYLSRIVSDLLMLASETDAMELDISPVGLDGLAWSSINSAAIDHSAVRVDIGSQTMAYVDATRIQQALVNLLSNASRYGGERIDLVGRVEGGDLTIEVHDDGPGIPAKYELLVWEKFERGPHRLNAVSPGSGVGLAVTKAIADAHGGSAGYRRSERLGGACFWIRLPGRVHTKPTVRRQGEVIAIDERSKSA